MLQSKYSAWLLCGLFVAILATSGYWCFWEYKAYQKQTQTFQRFISTATQNAIDRSANSSADLFLETLNKQVSEIINFPSVQSACIYVEGQLYAQFDRNSDETHCAANITTLKSRYSELSHYGLFKKAELSGTLAVHANPGYKNQFYRSLSMAFLLLLVNCLISIALYLQLYRGFRKSDQSPLEGLIKVSNWVTKDNNFKWVLPDYKGSVYQDIALAMNSMAIDMLANENTIHELTIQLQEKSDQLASQKKIHLDRQQNLQKMFAGASHDLRQPLQAMVIFLSSIKEGARPDQLPMIQKLEQVLENLNHLFTDLLDLSKLESRMKRIPKESIAIRPLLEKIHDEFEALANDKRIEFRLYQRDLYAYSNPNMLERIIRNMISNAIRYTRTGGVLIGSRKRENAIWIEVWDTGRGIPKNKMTEIFNEFVQIKDQNSEANKGVGLGLFIVKRLAQLLDHTIEVKSKLRQGTMFRIIVPIEPSPAKSEDKLAVLRPMESSISAPSNSSQPNLEPKSALTATQANILLVDDNEDIRTALSALLTGWGLRVFAFKCIDDLNTHYQNEPFDVDLLITDFQLEDRVTGVDVIDYVRANIHPTVPIIIISGTEEADVLREIKNAGERFLKKPIKPAKLRSLINVLVKQGKD